MPRQERSAATPVQELSTLLELWQWWLKEDYSLDLIVSDPSGQEGVPPVRHHYVFGAFDRREPASGEIFHFDSRLEELMDSLHRGEPLPGCNKPARIAGIRIVLFNQDVAYQASLETGPNKVEIVFDLSSVAFGKGRVPGYVRAVRMGRKWLIRPRHPEIVSLAGFEGDIDECLREIFLAASVAPHPYQEYIDVNKEQYEQALAGGRRIPE
ncbi:hypothetical protein [Paludibaculum fermentans]|uniref:hypothetical protein n=1 Tax=Paludibaculum fermentans TaxID=1473598 RepID=UPI003EBBABBC